MLSETNMKVEKQNLTFIIHASGFAYIQGIESRRRRRLLRGFRNAADAQELEQLEKWIEIKNFDHKK